MRKTTLLLLLLMLASVVCSAQQTTLTPWAKFQFMSGSWNAVGSGTPAAQTHILESRRLIEWFIERVIAGASDFACHVIRSASWHHCQGVVNVVNAGAVILTHT